MASPRRWKSRPPKAPKVTNRESRDELAPTRWRLCVRCHGWALLGAVRGELLEAPERDEPELHEPLEQVHGRGAATPPGVLEVEGGEGGCHAERQRAHVAADAPAVTASLDQMDAHVQAACSEGLGEALVQLGPRHRLERPQVDERPRSERRLVG